MVRFILPEIHTPIPDCRVLLCSRFGDYGLMSPLSGRQMEIANFDVVHSIFRLRGEVVKASVQEFMGYFDDFVHQMKKW